MSPLAPVEPGDSDVWEAVALGWVSWLITGRKEWVVRSLRSFRQGEKERPWDGRPLTLKIPDFNQTHRDGQFSDAVLGVLGWH